MDEDDVFEGAEAFADEIGETLTISASRFSSLIRSGLRSAIVEGHSLERVLKRAALSLSSSSLTAALRPLSNLLGQGMNAVVGGIGGALAGGAAAGAAKVLPFAEGGIVPPAAGAVPFGGGGVAGSARRMVKFAEGGVVGAATKLVPFAAGGVIGEPVAFRMPGGRTGLMGEAGREAVLPLARGTDGRLGVALEGGEGPTTVNVTINTQDAESFRRSESQVTAMLARAVARGKRGL
jgi:phage-related minor tail protein